MSRYEKINYDELEKLAANGGMDQPPVPYTVMTCNATKGAVCNYVRNVTKGSFCKQREVWKKAKELINYLK